VRGSDVTERRTDPSEREAANEDVFLLVLCQELAFLSVVQDDPIGASISQLSPLEQGIRAKHIQPDKCPYCRDRDAGLHQLGRICSIPGEHSSSFAE
jgi:hypothetical protein